MSSEARKEARRLMRREARRASAELGDEIDALRQRVRRLAPSHRDPERFHEEKWSIELALDRLARRLTDG